MIRRFFFILLAFLFLFDCFASDWAQWRGPHRNGVSDEKNLLPQWPAEGPKKIWESPIGSPAKKRAQAASPIVAGGKVFTVGRKADGKAITNIMHCFDARGGKLLWQYEWKGQYYQTCNGTPCVAHDTVFYLDGSANLLAISVKDGSLLWRKNGKDAAQGAKINTRYGASTSPMVVDEKVFVGTGGFLVKDGTAVFKPQLWGGFSSVLLGQFEQRKVLVTHEGGYDAAQGDTLWTIERCGAICTPVLMGDRLLNVGVDPEAEKRAVKHARMYRIKASNGRYEVEKIWAQAKLAASGNPRYQVPSFTVSGDHVYGRFGFIHKNLICFDLNTGQLKWTAGTKQTGMAGACYSSPLLADGKLFCLDGEGGLFMIKDDPSAFKLLAKAKVCGKTYASPALSNGHLYVQDAEKLVCLKLHQ